MNKPAYQICALIPAYNESARIGATVESLRSRRQIDCIVVVDDGSHDDTARRARAAGADIVITQQNAGKGAALTAAYCASPKSTEIFLLLDADLCASAVEAVKLLVPIVHDEADMVVGMLPPDPTFAAAGKSGGTGMVVRLAHRGIAQATGQSFRQPLSGQRAVRRAVLDHLWERIPERASGNTKGSKTLFAPGFGVEVGLTIEALRAGFRIVEVETHFRHNVTSSDWSGLSHRARQYVDIARAIRQNRK